MRLYKFYRKYTREELEGNEDLKIQEKYPLYAITCHKDLRDGFRDTRDMSKFIEKKMEITPDEYRDWANRERGFVLDWYEYTYKTSLKDLHPDDVIEECIKTVKIVSTWYEYNMVSDIDAERNMEKVIFSAPVVFQDEYIQPLISLMYFDFWQVYQEGIHRYDSLIESVNMDPGQPFLDVEGCTLTIFISQYGDTLKL